MAFAYRRPFVKERYREGPKWLSAGTKPKPGNMRHGLDPDGVIHVVEDWRFNDRFDENNITPTYVIYGDNTIQAFRYRTPGHLEFIERRVYDGQRLMRQHTLCNGAWGTEEHYDWDGERLIRVLTLCWKTDRVGSESAVLSGLKVTSFSEDRFQFDELARLERIEQHYLNEDGSVKKDLPPQVRYQRPKKSESIPQLAKQIERMLMEHIPAAAAKARGKGPFYCLLLCYCEEDFGAGWPPGLVLKTDAERQRIIGRGGDVAYYLWAPDESEDANVRVLLTDEPLEKHCELHCQLMDVKEDYSSAKKSLRSVAKALNEIDWSKIIDVTPDFIVAAVDNTGEVDFSTDIKASIPAQKFRALKERGLI